VRTLASIKKRSRLPAVQKSEEGHWVLGQRLGANGGDGNECFDARLEPRMVAFGTVVRIGSFS
jgi:hypothetical protein